MDLHDYMRLISEAEKNADVNSLTSAGVKVWPAIRAQVISMFRNPELYHKALAPLENRKLRLSEKLMSGIRSRRYIKRFRNDVREVIPSQKTNPEILFLSRGISHSDRVGDAWYDRFTDPFIELLQNRTNVLKLEVQKEKPADQKKRFLPSCIVPENNYRAYKYCLGTEEQYFSRQHFYGTIPEILPLKFNQRHLDSAWRDILYYRDLFREILKYVKPRFVFVKCYYEHDAAGLILAAREAGIRSVDIQHGKQGIDHPMYSHWTNIPETGYELLPDYFWTWGEESKNNIATWMNRADVHVPVVGGNLWLAKWKQSGAYEPTSAESEQLGKWSVSEKIVLVTLQPLDKDKIIPPHLAEVIRTSPATWTWLLRKHPFQKIGNEDLLQLIGPHSASVEIDAATSIPLYALLKHVNVHITQWSSTAFEANDFGVPTIIIHETGINLYKEQIKSGVFSASLNADEIFRWIVNGVTQQKTNYIETDPSVAESAFGIIGLKSGRELQL